MSNRSKVDDKWAEFLGHHDGVIGLYALFSKGVCRYVGKADCLASRLKHHLRKRDDVDEIRVWDLRDEVKGLSYEGTKAMHKWREDALIHKMRPVENIKRHSMHEDRFFSLPMDVKQKLIAKLPDL